MYTIGEIARIIGISRDKLRYYEEKGIIAPSQDDGNQYRQYDYEDILAILSIDFYRSLDIDFKGIKELHSAMTIEPIQAILSERRRAVDAEITRLAQIGHRLDDLLAGCEAIQSFSHQFSLKSIGPLTVHGEVSDFSAFEEFDAIHQLRNALGGASIIKSLIRQLSYDDTGIKESKMLIVSELPSSNMRQNSDRPESLHSPRSPVLQYDKCVYTVIEDSLDSGAAMQEIFNRTKQWLHQNGLKDKNVAFLRMIFIAPKAAQSKSYLELFVPVD